MWLEDFRAAVVGSHDVQQPPASLAAVPVRTHTQGHITGSQGTQVSCWMESPGIGLGRSLVLRQLLCFEDAPPCLMRAEKVALKP